MNEWPRLIVAEPGFQPGARFKAHYLLRAAAPMPRVTVKGKQLAEGGVVTWSGHLGCGVPADQGPSLIAALE